MAESLKKNSFEFLTFFLPSLYYPIIYSLLFIIFIIIYYYSYDWLLTRIIV